MSSPSIAIPPSPSDRTPNPVRSPDDSDNEHEATSNKNSRASRNRNTSWSQSISRSWSVIFQGGGRLHDSDDDENDNNGTDGQPRDSDDDDDDGQPRSHLNGASHRNHADITIHDDTERTPLIPKLSQPKKSSFSQSLFNSVNLLAGMGVLTLPYTFKLTGWLVGTGLLITFAATTSHTAVLLAKCLDHPKVKGPGGLIGLTYGDVGEAAFGLNGRRFISAVFVCQMMAACVAYCILIGDSIHALFPQFQLTYIKLVTFLVLTPTTWPKSMQLLSYTSFIGIIALLNMIAIILFDGLTTHTSPGSILVPETTSLLPPNINVLPMAIGLTMVGLDGHAVFPSLYRDLGKPKRFSWIVTITYIIVLGIYIVIAGSGYLMFGENCKNEITQNLPTVPSFNPQLTQMTVWLVAINPMTKYPLLLSPVNTQIENTLHTTFVSAYQHQGIVRIISRSIVSLLVVVIAIYYPGFTNVMALLGSGFSFTVAVVFPLLCFLKLYGDEISLVRRLFYKLVIVLGAALGLLGTVYSFLPTPHSDL
ncbi:hypothetical protein SmJEL517_g04840 [Synchytrium microbalum]|uniref:Amino acid transporter transmembrane domain-containing protein n=1 Tax=Synchytrium microbalum TaxID=1806994 RepID=A0A507BXT1_9FUNG|nr:uncharacterized protein SmJEL517_g04840 [Synchytrium microbalum]TPX31938.1 hypothetical protein SmJEL517_g04840 [Synchytrium microbalum]